MKHVIHHATEYVRLMSQLTPPDAFYFRTYVSDGVPGLRELCTTAASCAVGEEADAVASLVLSPGPSDTFRIEGTHARGTLCLCPTPYTRLYVIVALFVAVIVLMLWMKRRS